MIALPTNDVELRREVEATYWTYRIMGEFPDDSSYEMCELVEALLKEGMWLAIK